VTQLLQAIDKGDPRAPEALLPLVYDELRGMAAAKMAREKPGADFAGDHIGSAWLKVSQGSGQGWQNQRHFFGAAAEAMRRILIDRDRRDGDGYGRGLGYFRVDYKRQWTYARAWLFRELNDLIQD